MKTLRRTLFGNPILREKARHLTEDEILSKDIQLLIAAMRDSLTTRKFGVGLAAPQIGRSIALSVIAIKPTPNRPNVEKVDMVVINPEVVRTYGRRTGMWEGCLSFGSGPDSPYAKALRYKKIRVRYFDESAKRHEADFEGLTAHVLQHEIDHLNGVLFVDRVKDPKTYITQSEYRKRIAKPPKRKPNP